ncbi:enoyl-CoA hydratase/isomerase family protein, partial [Streptomyces sp. NPDC059627]
GASPCPRRGGGCAPAGGPPPRGGRPPGQLPPPPAPPAPPRGPPDAMLCGLADHYMPSGSIEAFVADLAALPVPEALARQVRQAPDGELAAHRAWIDACYPAGTVEEIVQRLLAHGDPAAKEAADTLLTRSPTALKVTLKALRRARRLGSLERVLDQEYRVSCATLTSHDLVEGIRAQVVDKDRAPHWSPAALAEVTDTDVERFFAPLGERELGLAPPA